MFKQTCDCVPARNNFPRTKFSDKNKFPIFLKYIFAFLWGTSAFICLCILKEIF